MTKSKFCIGVFDVKKQDFLLNMLKQIFKTLILSFFSPINTSYLTDSYIVFTLKMESVSENTIFGLKMMVKSGLDKIFLKFLQVGDYFFLINKSYLTDLSIFFNLKLESVFFLDHFSPPFLG